MPIITMPPYWRIIPPPSWNTAGNITEVIIDEGVGGGANDLYGQGVVISGDGLTMAIGARGANSGNGAVYVYVWGGASWSLEQTITSTEPNASDGYGGFGNHGVTISDDGDTLVIADAAKDDIATNSGTVYVWTRSATVWSQAQEINTNTGETSYGRFGKSVALSGDGNTLAIGHPFVDVGGRTNNGQVEVWALSGTWTHQQTLSEPNLEEYSAFGYNISLSYDGNVGAFGGYGQDYFTGATTYTTSFGDVNKDILFTSTYTGFLNDIPSNKLRIIYVISGNSTPLTIATSDLGTGYFEITINVETDAGGLGISTSNEIETAVDTDGTAPTYVTTTQQGTGAGVITAAASGYLTSGAAVWAYSGACNTYTRSGTTWTHQQTLKGAVPTATYDYFTFPMEMSSDGKTIIAAAPYDDDTLAGSGAAYIFVESGGTWTLEDTLTASDEVANGNFGDLQVGLSGDGNVAIVGAKKHSTGNGAMYVFTRTGTTWTEKQIVSPSEVESNQYMGINQAPNSITTDGFKFVAGAPYNDVGANTNQGAVYVYDYTNP